MSLFESAIGWLAPPDCVGCGQEGAALCQACSTSDILPYGERCWRCGQLSSRAKTCASCGTSGGPRFVWITTDYETTAQKLVQKYKFGHLRVAADVMTELTAETFRTYNSDDQIAKANYLVVPVPTASSRIRSRSFDHGALLARRIARNLKLEFAAGLGRLGQSRQVGARRDIRLKQAANNYFIRLPGTIAGRNILLIDDVVTTGATLQAASHALRKGGAKHVDALLFAKRL